jgi:hypothetical protein
VRQLKEASPLATGTFARPRGLAKRDHARIYGTDGLRQRERASRLPARSLDWGGGPDAANSALDKPTCTGVSVQVV